MGLLLFFIAIKKQAISGLISATRLWLVGAKHLMWCGMSIPQHAVVRGKAQSNLVLNGASGTSRRAGSPTKQTHRQQTWREYWQEFAKLPRWPKPEFQAWPTDLFHQLEFIVSIPLTELPFQVAQDAVPYPPYRQVGGRTAAVQLFKSFLAERGARYQATISSPLTAEFGCSRLSPHLAYGTVSIRELLRQLELTLQQRHERQWRKSLQSFQSRLVWHCYFMQKLEANPAAEQRNMHKLYDAFEPTLAARALFCMAIRANGMAIG